MKERRILVEMYESGEDKINYIVRVQSKLPNLPFEFAGCFDCIEDLTKFFINL